jgi:hypothetical protein
VSVRDREDAVVARLHTLAPHLEGDPDPAFREAARARLVAMAAVRSPAPEPMSRWRRMFTRTNAAAPARWRTRVTAGLAGAALTVTALATLVAVATDARPGDVLYGLKRGTEETQLALAGDARGQTLLDFARTRLHELQEITEGGTSALPAAGAATSDGTVTLAAEVDPALVLDTLATMDEQTTDGAAWLTDRAVDTGNTAPLDQLAAWSEEQSTGLAALRAALPASTVDDVDGSLVLLADIGTRTVAIDEVLGCASGPPIEATDPLGPVPGLCLDGQPTPPVAGGEESPGTVPAPGSGSESGSPTVTAAPPVPPGGGTHPGDPTGEGSGEGGELPTAEVPRGGGSLPTVPVPTIPLPSASVPGLPGSSTGGGSSSSAGPTSRPPVDVDICIGPIVVGNCP